MKTHKLTIRQAGRGLEVLLDDEPLNDVTRIEIEPLDAADDLIAVGLVKVRLFMLVTPDFELPVESEEVAVI